MSALRRGYPGDENERRTLSLLRAGHAASSSHSPLEAPGRRGISDFQWSPSGRLLIDQVSDTGAERWLYVVEPGPRHARAWCGTTAATRASIRPTSRAGIPMAAGSWSSPTWASAISSSSSIPMRRRPRRWRSRPTPGTWRASAAPPPLIAHAGTQALFFTGTGRGPYERHVYRLARGRSRAGGAHVAARGARAGAVARRPPPRVALVGRHHAAGAARGRGARRRDARRASPPRRRRSSRPRPWVRPRYQTFTNRVDGFEVHARILEPAGLDRTTRHPVIFGPVYSNTVRNRWGGLTGTLQQYLVQRGYIVVQVDVRGSVGYGRALPRSVPDGLRRQGSRRPAGRGRGPEDAALRGRPAHRHLGQQLRRPAQRLRAAQAPRPVRGRRGRRARHRPPCVRTGRRGHHARARHASRGLRARLGACPSAPICAITCSSSTA